MLGDSPVPRIKEPEEWTGDDRQRATYLFPEAELVKINVGTSYVLLNVNPATLPGATSEEPADDAQKKPAPQTP
jgi:hypothetical protein